MNVDEFIERNPEHFLKVSSLGKHSQKTVTCFYDMKNGVVTEMANAYEHMKYLSEKFPWVKEKVTRFEEWAGEEADLWEQNLAPGEHPEWHGYEIWMMDERAERDRDILIRVAEEESLVRVGFFGRRFMEFGPIGHDKYNKFFLTLGERLDIVKPARTK